VAYAPVQNPCTAKSDMHTVEMATNAVRLSPPGAEVPDSTKGAMPVHVICHATYIEIEGPLTFKHDDRVGLETDAVGNGTVFLHLQGPNRHEATIELSTEDARGLARELKKSAAESAVR
jgi:hypothetical protein